MTTKTEMIVDAKNMRELANMAEMFMFTPSQIKNKMRKLDLDPTIIDGCTAAMAIMRLRNMGNRIINSLK